MRRLKDANDAQLLRGSWALECSEPKKSNVTHGPMYTINTNYGKFFYEALVKPLGQGYVFITGKGGNHIIAVQFATGPFGGYQLNGHIDNATGGVETTVNFQSVDEIPSGEWAHIALWYDQNYIVSIINGIPCGISPGTLYRRSEDDTGLVGFTGGSDHINGNFRIACQRIFEGTLPYAGAYGSVQRPPILEMSAGVVINGSDESVNTAYFLSDYRNGDLRDSSKNCFNGYLYETGNGVYASISRYTDPNTGNRDLAKLPTWVIDPFAYSNNHPAPVTPPTGALFYDSFGREDVHYGKYTAPLHLGALEVGGVSWIDSGYGIINGNAFTTDFGFDPAVFNTSRQDVDVKLTRPIAWDTTISSYHLYLRYADTNNWVRVQVSDGPTNSVSVQQSVAGSVTTIATPAAFTANAWTQLRATIVGTALNVYEGNVLRGGPYTINAGLTGTKTGFRHSTPLTRCSEFAVFAA
jgi:hypothetical protein